MRLVFRVLSALMAGLFVFAAVVQYNDPDPVRWMAIYLSAAVACVFYVRGRLRWYFPLLIGLIALAWAGTLVWHVAGQISFSQLFEAWEMANPAVEEGREMYGLLITAGWMAVLVVATWNKRQPRASEQAAG